MQMLDNRSLHQQASRFAMEPIPAERMIAELVREEVAKETASIWKKLQQEREFRHTLEEQIKQLRGLLYTRTEIDTRLDRLKQNLLEGVDNVQAACDADMTAARRELRQRLATTTGVGAAAAKAAAKATSGSIARSPQPADERFEKITADITKGLNAVRAEITDAISAAFNQAQEHTESVGAGLSKSTNELRTCMENGFSSLRARVEEMAQTDSQLESKIRALQSCLEHKLGS